MAEHYSYKSAEGVFFTFLRLYSALAALSPPIKLPPEDLPFPQGRWDLTNKALKTMQTLPCSTQKPAKSGRRFRLAVLLLTISIAVAALFVSVTPSSGAGSPGGREKATTKLPGIAHKGQSPQDLKEPRDVAAFRESVAGDIRAVIIELKDAPGVLRKIAAKQAGNTMSVKAGVDYNLSLYAKQNNFISSLASRGVRALPRQADVKQIDGSVRHIEYRFTYLLNGFVAYVAIEDIERLRLLPEVASVSEPEQ